MTAYFFNPVRTCFGPGSLNEISTLAANKKVTLVTFPEARGLGLVERIGNLLGDRLIHVVEDVQPNPDVSYLKDVYESFWQQAGQTDIVLAVGGGSAIDTAKALIVGTQTGTFQELLDLLSTSKAFTPVQAKSLVAVPTTAGTGSEVTPWATIWDQQAQKKYSLHLEQTWPAVAIIDPELMLTVPEKVTVSTGLDALSHALESIWNVNANPISDTFAVSAIQDILTYLPLLQKDLGNIQLRSKMALAALKAGMAFSNTKTALAHSISYEMTLRHGLPHGIACSFTLPFVLGLAWGCDPSRDLVFESLFGPDRKQAQAHLRDFLLSVGVKTEFEDYGVGPDEQAAMITYAMQGARGKNFIAA